jgi:hypothetical protein
MSISDKQKIISANNVIIAENEQKVFDAGYEKGKAEGGGSYDEGYNVGYEEGHNEGYADGHFDGKQAERDAFWDALQDNGNRDTYQYAFANLTLGWTDEIYNPKYPIICSSTIYAASNTFYQSSLTDIRVPVTLRNTRADYTFGNAKNLKRIPSLTLENVSRYVGTFQKCEALETLIVYGTIDIDGFNVGDCKKLSRDSIGSIVDALSTETSGLTCTLSLDAVNKAFETSEGANDGSTSADWIALDESKDNWAISLI